MRRKKSSEANGSKHLALVDRLRGQIIRGSLPPGSRLPKRTDIKEQYEVANDTVQAAFDMLNRDGFIIARRGHGTVVTENPPHLHRYGLVFAANPADRLYWRRFDAAILQAATELARATDDTFVSYYNFRTSAGELSLLQEDVQAHRLAGIIQLAGYAESAEIIGSSEPPMPAVDLRQPGAGRAVPSVYVDHASFLERALHYLTEHGRRRVAILTATGGFWPDHEAEVLRIAGDLGVCMHPYWVQRVSPAGAEGAANCMHLLMHKGQDERPDGLIVTDDNLTGHALAGLMAAGVRVGQDLEVVSHWNFPLDGTAGLPVCRLGFDARAALSQCIELLQQQRAGVSPDGRPHWVPAVFAHELTGTAAMAVTG